MNKTPEEKKSLTRAKAPTPNSRYITVGKKRDYPTSVCIKIDQK